jgi:Ni/Co efflux regulator RcnB
MGSTSTSGHYQAYVLNATNQQQNWINFDDDYVTQITVQNTM